jgi:hypothetical protein
MSIVSSLSFKLPRSLHVEYIRYAGHRPFSILDQYVSALVAIQPPSLVHPRDRASHTIELVPVLLPSRLVI